MTNYRKKPVTIEAEQWWGRDSSLSKEDLQALFVQAWRYIEGERAQLELPL